MITEKIIMDMVREEMAAGRLILPTLPDVALSIGEIISREDVNAARVAQEIAKDPATAARLLAAANCTGVRGAGKAVDNLAAAITRLGFGLTRTLVNRITMEQMFCARSGALNQMMKTIWSCSLEVAALSRVLSRQCAALNTETAMLAGLVHLVGVLPIIRLIDLHHKIENEAPQIEQTIFKLQADVGQLVLKAWKLPPDLVAIPQMAYQFDRRHEGPADYGDVINVAILMLNHQRQEVDRTRVPAFSALGMNAEIEVMEMPKVQEAYEKSLDMLGG